MSLKVLSANFTGICYLRTFVGALVNHQIVGFCKASLAEFAHKFTLWSHLTTKIRPTVVIINSHYRKHFSNFALFFCYYIFWQKYYKNTTKHWKFTSSQVCVDIYLYIFIFNTQLKCLFVYFFFVIFAAINSAQCIKKSEMKWNHKKYKR